MFTQEKKDLLFLHGYLADKNSFCYQIPFLKNDFNVYAFDLKGFGQNADMEYPYCLDDYVKEVKDFITRNGLKKPCVIAHSFGGRIAIKLAAKEEDAFEKIVLTGAAGLKPKRSLRYKIKTAAFRCLKQVFSKEKLTCFYSKDYAALSPVMKESFIKIVNEHLDGSIEKIKNPTLIIFGEKDKETPPYMAKKLKDGIKNSKLVFVKEAGHFCFIDKPYKFNMEVREFLLSE